MHGELQLRAKQITTHNDVIEWKNNLRYWPFVNSPHKCQWRRALMFSLIYVWINDWVNDPEAGDLRRHRVHYNVTVMSNYALNTLIQHILFCGTHSCIFAPTPVALSTCKWLQSIILNWCTEHGRYRAANFLQIPYNRHPITGPWRRGMGCLMWV